MVDLTKNAMQGTSGSVARCRKSFGSHKDRAEESASQLGNHVFGRGFSLDASLYGDMVVYCAGFPAASILMDIPEPRQSV